MSVDELLRAMGPTGSAPSISELGGQKAIARELDDLDPDVMPRLIEAIADDWQSLTEPHLLLDALVARLADIQGPLAFAASTDGLLGMTVAVKDISVTRSLMTTLVTVAE